MLTNFIFTPLLLPFPAPAPLDLAALRAWMTFQEAMEQFHREQAGPDACSHPPMTADDRFEAARFAVALGLPPAALPAPAVAV